MKTKTTILILLLALPLAAQQRVIVVSKGRTDGGSGITPYPQPTHQWDVSDGSGATIAAQRGAVNLACTNLGTWATSPTAADFNGTTSECTAEADILVNLTAWTFSFCLQADSRGENNNGTVINKGSSTTVNDWRVEIGGGAGTERFQELIFNTAEAFDRWHSPAASLAVDGATWAHWLVSCTNYSAMAGSCIWYKDGSALTTGNDNSNTGTRRDSTGFALRVGNRVGATDRTLGGRLRKLKAWNSSLSAGDAALVAAGDPCGT
jgi:hypothetical protein